MRVLSLGLLLIFAFESLPLPRSFAEEIKKVAPSTFPELPADAGMIVQASTSYGQKKGPLVIHIQDAHATPSAQLCIEEILNWIAQNAALLGNDKSRQEIFLGLEGADGPIYPQYLNVFGHDDQEINEAVAKDLLEKGELTGAELFSWREAQKRKPQKINWRIEGVETLPLFKDNLRIYKALVKKQKFIREMLKRLQSELDSVSTTVLSQQLKSLLDEIKKHREGDFDTRQISPQWGAYALYIRETAQSVLGIDLDQPVEQIRFPQLVRFLTISRPVSEEEQRRASLQRSSLLKKWSVSDQKDLRDLATQLSGKDISRRLFENLAWELESNEPAPASYSSYLIELQKSVLQQEIKPEDLLAEMNRIEAAVENKLAQTQKERDFLSLLRDFDAMKKIMTLSLTRQGYAGLQSRIAVISPAHIQSRIELIKSNHEANTGVSYPHEFLFNEAVRFYHGAEVRDSALISNLMEKSRGAGIAVLVSGGFHTEGMSRILESKGLRHLVIRPSISEPAEDGLQEKVFTEAHADLSRLYGLDSVNLNKQERLFLKELFETALPLLRKKDANEAAARKLAEAINQHPILSRRMKASSVMSQRGVQLSIEMPVSPQFIRPSIEASGAVMATHAVSEALLLSPQSVSRASNHATFYFELANESGLSALSNGLVSRNALSSARSELRNFENLPSEKKFELVKRKLEELGEAADVKSWLIDYWKNGSMEFHKAIFDVILDGLEHDPDSNFYKSAWWVYQEYIRYKLERGNGADDVVREYKTYRDQNTIVSLKRAQRLIDLLEYFLTLSLTDDNAIPYKGMDSYLRKSAEYALYEIEKAKGRDLESTVSVFGMGSVGLVSSALLAENMRVIGIDHPSVAARINEQTSTVGFEPGLRDLVLEGKEEGNLRIKPNDPWFVSHALRNSAAVYLDAGDPNGRTPTQYTNDVTDLARMIGQKLREIRIAGDNQFRALILRGAFLPGTTRAIKRIIYEESGQDQNFDVVYQPDFTRRGNTVSDVRENQIVVGLELPDEIMTREQIEVLPVMKVLQPVLKHLQKKAVSKTKVKVMSLEAAELSKLALIDYLFSKQVLGNELAATVSKLGGNLRDVMKVAGLDSRIGEENMVPVISVGGRLLEQEEFYLKSFIEKVRKKERFLIPNPNELPRVLEEFREYLKRPNMSDARFQDNDYLMMLNLMINVTANKKSLRRFEEHISSDYNRVQSVVFGDSGRRLNGDSVVSVLGVAYKPGTDEITESSAVKLIEWLIEVKKVKRFKIYDPLAIANFKKWIEQKKLGDQKAEYLGVSFIYEDKDPMAILAGHDRNGPKFAKNVRLEELPADLVLIGAPLAEVKALSLSKIKHAIRDSLLVDGVNLYSVPGPNTNGNGSSVKDVQSYKINYLAFGSPLSVPDSEDERPIISQFIPADEPLPYDGTEEPSAAVIGQGYVGVVTAAVQSASGNRVVGLDIDPEIIEKLSSGKAHIKESGLEKFLRIGIENRKLSFALTARLESGKQPFEAEVTDGLRDAVTQANVIFFAVDTPPGPTGEANLNYIETVTHQIGKVLKEMDPAARQAHPKLIIVKSTVPPSTFEFIEGRLASYGLRNGIDYLLSSAPEFLVEGRAIKDGVEPNRTVFGIHLPKDASLTLKSFHRARGLFLSLLAPIRKNHPHPVLITDAVSSSSGKYLANSLLASKVSSANLLAGLARDNHTFYTAIENVLREDPRISQYTHSRCGPGYGGHCFPKDLRAMTIVSSGLFGADSRVMSIDYADILNEIMKRRPARMIGESLVGAAAGGYKPLSSYDVGISGLVFKEDTDDVRESPSVATAIELALMGAHVRLYDINFSNEEMKKKIQKSFKEEVIRLFIEQYGQNSHLLNTLGIPRESRAMKAVVHDYFFNGDRPLLYFEEDANEMLRHADAVAFLSPEEAYTHFDLNLLNRKNRNNVKVPVLDTRGLFTTDRIIRSGIFSPGIGRPDIGNKYTGARSELRELPLSLEAVSTRPLDETSRFAGWLAETLSTRSGSKVFSPRASSLKTLLGPAALYSLPELAAEARSAGLDSPDPEAAGFAASRLLSRDEINPMSTAEAEALGAGGKFSERFFTPENPQPISGRYVLAENLDQLPPVDSLMKLWLRYLAAHPSRMWLLDVDDITQAQANDFRDRLYELAKSSGLPVKQNQIAVTGSNIRGYDKNTLKQLGQAKRLHGFFASNNESFTAVPKQGSTVFLLTSSSDLKEKTAERLLAAEALAHVFQEPFKILAAKSLASASEFESLLTSLRAYTAVQTAA